MDFIYEGRHAGVLLHPTSLPSTNGIVGDIGRGALEFIDYLRDAGFSCWQVLPLAPCMCSKEHQGCPYLSTSSFALNPILCCPENLIKDGLLTKAELTIVTNKWKKLLQLKKKKTEGVESGTIHENCETFNSCLVPLYAENMERLDKEKTERSQNIENKCQCRNLDECKEIEQSNANIIGGRLSDAEKEATQQLQVPEDEQVEPVQMQYPHDGKAEDYDFKNIKNADRDVSCCYISTGLYETSGKNDATRMTSEQPVKNYNEDKWVDDDAFIDFFTAKGFKEEILVIAYRHFCEFMNVIDDFLDFKMKNAYWLESYVLFEAIQARYPRAQTWLEWPHPYNSLKHVHKDDVINEHLAQPLCVDPDKYADITVPAYHEFVQYVLSKQWAETKKYANMRGIKIFGDIAFYVNLHSSDVWSHKELFAIDPETGKPLFVSGVPPDYFSEDGQLWGHPVYAWDVHARTNFKWWTKRISHSFEKFDICRLDHFRGFEAFWRVPYQFARETGSAKQGEWVQGPSTKLFDAIFKNLGWTIPRVNVAQGYAEALKQQRKEENSFMKKIKRLLYKKVKIPIMKSIGITVGENPKNLQRSFTQPIKHSFGSFGAFSGFLGEQNAPLLIAEDLGFITPDIAALRDKYSIFSMRVLQFAWADDEKGLKCEHLPYNIQKDCVVYTGTHDNATSLEWWKNAPQEQKQHLVEYLGLTSLPDEKEIPQLLSRMAMASVAYMAIIPAQDLLSLDDRARFNQPGEVSLKNWSWRLKSLEGLQDPQLVNSVRKMIKLSGRLLAGSTSVEPKKKRSISFGLGELSFIPALCKKASSAFQS